MEQVTHRLRRFWKNPFVYSGGVVLAGSVGANGINYLFNLVMGRMLSPDEYGSVAAIVTFSMLTAAPSLAVSLFLGSHISAALAQGKYAAARGVSRRTARVATWIGLGMACIFFAASSALGSFFHIPPTHLALVSVAFVFSVASSAQTGTLQGLSQFAALSFSQVVAAASKLFLSVLLVAAGVSVRGVVMALVGSTLVHYLFVRLRSRAAFRSLPDEPETERISGIESAFRDVWQSWRTVIVVSVCVSLFQNLDVVLAKRFLSAYDAGQYAALAILGRVITYGSMAVVTVLLPTAAAAHAAQDGSAQQHLKAALGTVAGLSLGGALVFWAFPEGVVGLLFGSAYAGIAVSLPVMGLAMAFGSCALVFVHFGLAVHSRLFVYPLAGAVAVVAVGMALYGRSVEQMAYVQVWANAMFFVGMAGMWIYENRRV